MLATKDVLRTLLRGIMQCIRRLGLPEVTAAENGRILKVVRGAWAAVQPDPITAADLPRIPAEKLPETVPVPASAGQAGQVLGVQADGTKGYVWPQLMDGTLTPGYRVTANGLAQYFVIDVAQPWLGRFTLPSITTRVEIRNSSTGETISQYGLNTPAEVNVRIVRTRIISLFCTYSTGLLRRYDYLFVAQDGLEPGWHVQDLNYIKTETDALLAAKLDAPADGTAGQVLTKLGDEAGSVGWADLPSATKVADYTVDIPSAPDNETLPLDLTNEILRRGAKLHLQFSADGIHRTRITIYLPIASGGFNNSVSRPGYSINSYLGTPELWVDFQAYVGYPFGWTEGDPATEGLRISIYDGKSLSSDGKPTEKSSLRIEKIFVEF